MQLWVNPLSKTHLISGVRGCAPLVGNVRSGGSKKPQTPNMLWWNIEQPHVFAP
jgi:hypothetical protein